MPGEQAELLEGQEEKSKQPIRVCYPFVGNNVGGSHISTITLVRHLDPAEVEHLIVLHEEGLLPGFIQKQGLTFELVGIPGFFQPPYWSLRNIAALLRQTSRIAKFIRKHRIDVVHTNDVRIHFGWTLAVRLAGAKLLWHQRTGSFGSGFVKLALALLSHQVVCISRYTASTLPKRLSPLIRIVANPFNTEFARLDRGEARTALLEELGLVPECRLIGFFGNLVKQKRPAVFLRAAARILETTNSPLAFLLFGADRNGAQAELTQLAESLGIKEHVYFMGFRSPIEPCMAGCDVIMAPGIGEGLGRSLVEAMIVGTPVVAADSGGHREVIENGKTGFLALADDPGSFAAAAGKILQDGSLAARIAGHAKDTASRNYSTSRHVSEITDVYRRIAGIRPDTVAMGPTKDV